MVASRRAILVPWSEVIDRNIGLGRSFIRATSAVWTESALPRVRCISRSIRVWLSTSVPIAESWLSPIMKSPSQCPTSERSKGVKGHSPMVSTGC